MVRPKVNPCKAKVQQRGDSFEPGIHSHNHSAPVGSLSFRSIELFAESKMRKQDGVYMPLHEGN